MYRTRQGMRVHRYDTYQGEISTAVDQLPEVLPPRDWLHISETCRSSDSSVWYTFVVRLLEANKSFFGNEDILTPGNHAAKGNCTITIVSENDCMCRLDAILV